MVLGSPCLYRVLILTQVGFWQRNWVIPKLSEVQAAHCASGSPWPPAKWPPQAGNPPTFTGDQLQGPPPKGSQPLETGSACHHGKGVFPKTKNISRLSKDLPIGIQKAGELLEAAGSLVQELQALVGPPDAEIHPELLAEAATIPCGRAFCWFKATRFPVWDSHNFPDLEWRTSFFVWEENPL